MIILRELAHRVDPALWVREVLGKTPSAWQDTFLRVQKRQRSSVIDKSVLALSEPRRVRDREHIRYVNQQSWLICGRRPSDAHHLRFAQSRALGRKASDEFTVPLCREHHREVHHSGDEATWWQRAGIDPFLNARALWLQTHPLSTNNSDRLGGKREAFPK
jgi:hypothetical protein